MKSAIQSSGGWLSSAIILLLAAVTFLAQSVKTAPLSDPGMLRALILSGGGNQDSRASADLLRAVLLDTGRFEVKVSEAPVGLTAATLGPFDLIVDDYDGPSLGNASEKALDTFVASGKGLVVTRSGLASAAASEPNLAKLAKISSAKASSPAEPIRLFELKPAPTEHPIMHGLKPNLRTGDAPMHNFSIQPGAEVLALSEREEPALFVSTHGKGRVFCTALGNGLAPMQETAFITTFARGSEWAASGKVTLPGEIGFPGPKTNGPRVLVVTGGHDHEASFYGLFNGYKDFGWVPVTDSKLAFQQDIRAKYDVVVFYDFTRDLDEKGRKNLRDFVESGKGIVVLHHGILNFQKWPWWYEEVVGGLYRLERQGSIPNSTVKYGEEHWITAAGQHPITDGITPFHVTDETYKGLLISTNIQPLLLTDNTTSDRTVAWIGPCTTSKVVFIQIGHDHTPFRHPSYQALVRNSILWTAGKLK